MDGDAGKKVKNYSINWCPFSRAISYPFNIVPNRRRAYLQSSGHISMGNSRLPYRPVAEKTPRLDLSLLPALGQYIISLHSVDFRNPLSNPIQIKTAPLQLIIPFIFLFGLGQYRLNKP